MAFLNLDREKLTHNYNTLEMWFSEANVEWGVVAKILCGNTLFLEELVKLGVTEFHDTRISNLKAIKKVAPDAQTVYIKPPAIRNIPQIVSCADVSFNTELSTIKLLSEEAQRQNKIHKIIIMVEMGDLREGVIGEKLMDFYAEVVHTPNINIVGLGTNLNCLNGILPSHDKLVQLCLYKQLIETRFNIHIPWVSGGTSVTVPLLLENKLPKSVNHFRIGEMLFFGLNLFTNKTIFGMNNDVFKLYAEIIELYEKPKTPSGTQSFNVAGETPYINPDDIGKKHYRAILDIGLLDCNPKYMVPDEENVEIIEASSDMLVLDLGGNGKNHVVGDLLSFKLTYMGVLGLMNSKYIGKYVI